MSYTLMIYGVALIAAGFVIARTIPELRNSALMVGSIATGVIAIAGIALLGHCKRRLWAILANTVVILVLLHASVQVWLSPGPDEPALGYRVFVSLMFLLSVGISAYLFHAERPPGFYQAPSRPTR